MIRCERPELVKVLLGMEREACPYYHEQMKTLTEAIRASSEVPEHARKMPRLAAAEQLASELLSTAGEGDPMARGYVPIDEAQSQIEQMIDYAKSIEYDLPISDAGTDNPT